MTQAFQLGPLVLPYALLATGAALGLGGLAGMRFGRRAGLDVEPLLWRMLLVGLLGARLMFVWEWHASYLAQPLSLLDVRDGGWNLPAGLVAACFYGLHRARGQRALRRPVLAAVLATSLAGMAGALLLLSQAAPTAPLPALSLASLQGPPVLLSDYAGKPTVINLWATWCPPCRREMPVLRQAQADRADVNFVFVNQGEAPAAIAGYLGRNGLADLRNVLVDERRQAGLALGGQNALPTTLFYDARGRLVETRIGALSPATLAQQLAKLREGAAASPPTGH